ncbi:hypothetical protein trd_A0891 (plasmid) [Thermomicrobium roseum DSM 5159]|uniref:Uncharacterized protein n=1 Tax=Thermomicrobium roseum (strain ATCC 27502 / DSM 5159 / P-2) TaxID=309801 RepID=B9L527_THERP|nr:hypothetical protein trd_A0891 [Thermomicrobium roseum DSM 5159]
MDDTSEILAHRRDGSLTREWCMVRPAGGVRRSDRRVARLVVLVKKLDRTSLGDR